METHQLLINLILYGLLPLWGISGLADWLCHRATDIEHTSGLKESLIHSLMGIQMGIPIILCLLFYVNVGILLICIAAWLAHEIVAHWDVSYTSPIRKITIWEAHAHNYLATLPLFLLMLVAVINWEIVIKLVTLDWVGQFEFRRIEKPHGSPTYLKNYLLFMAVVCVFPYLEENIRCLRVYLKERTA
ncbi:MAG: diguanylate cyclase [Thiotrichales bacterium SG8_50]|nr:MAG: diguanylate cyclase [Thiotrichales bacterium SG8_50]